MSLSAHDERELLLPLLDGIHEQPLWEAFLKRLLARTRSSQVCLLIRTATMTTAAPVMRHCSARAGTSPPDWTALEKMGLAPFAALRPFRVYALEEMLTANSPQQRARQRRELAGAGMGQARFIHIATRQDHHAWLVLIHERMDFSAADGALLAALAAPLASSLTTLSTLDELRLRSAVAEEALDLLGIDQRVLDPEARVLSARHDRALVHRSPQLIDGCAAVAAGSVADRKVLRREQGEEALLLRPVTQGATALPTSAAAICLRRREPGANPQGASRIIQAELGLSQREAAMAEALSRGLSLMEAGKSLRLTPETTRNYSKRIYAKTGAAGQADLVRMVLTGLAPLA